MIINLDWLKSKDACQGNIDIFCTEWPDGCEANRQNLERAIVLELDMTWFATNVLPEDKFAEYRKKTDLLFTEYNEKRAPFYAEYQEKFALINDEYNEKFVLFNNEYRSKIAPTNDECDSKLAPLDAEYRAKLAPLDAEYKAKIDPIQAQWKMSTNALAIDTLVDFFGQDNTQGDTA